MMDRQLEFFGPDPDEDEEDENKDPPQREPVPWPFPISDPAPHASPTGYAPRSHAINPMLEVAVRMLVRTAQEWRTW